MLSGFMWSSQLSRKYVALCINNEITLLIVSGFNNYTKKGKGNKTKKIIKMKKDISKL